jgi:hypothetical protein
VALAVEETEKAQALTEIMALQTLAVAAVAAVHLGLHLQIIRAAQAALALSLSVT